MEEPYVLRGLHYMEPGNHIFIICSTLILLLIQGLDAEAAINAIFGMGHTTRLVSSNYARTHHHNILTTVGER